jgi:hypothetical protein
LTETWCPNFAQQKTITMNIHFRKRKKTVFNNHKAVRVAISLNSVNVPSSMITRQEVKEENNWEQHWIEQIAEMRLENVPLNQSASKQNKLIIKWWEN